MDIVTSRFRCRPAGKKRVRPRKTIGSRATGVELHHPVSAGFGRRISEGAGQKGALAGEQF
jgi:hypothetical protein